MFFKYFSPSLRNRFVLTLPKGSHTYIVKYCINFCVCLPFKSSGVSMSISPVSNGTFNMSHSRFTSLPNDYKSINSSKSLLSRIF